MKLLDSRRLTGLNRVSPGAGAVADVSFEPGEDPRAAVEAWSEAIDRCLARLGWSDRSRWIRMDEGSASLVVAAAWPS